MPKEAGRNDRRSRIAHGAARIMAEDGVEDYALAKRKAARQVGDADSRELPTNEEIDEALRAYRQIYHQEEHRDRIRALRATALRAMREFAQFNPHLTGSVLSGNAGKYADVNLQLYADSPKAVELYLLDRDIPYRTAQSRLYCGGAPVTAPVYVVTDEDIEIELTVLSPRELRTSLRASPDGKAIERAKLAAVEQLLAES
jgi:hypothetical protein